MKHIAVTCKHHPELRWSVKEAGWSEYGFNNQRNLFFNLGPGVDAKPECACSAKDLVLVKHTFVGKLVGCASTFIEDPRDGSDLEYHYVEVLLGNRRVSVKMDTRADMIPHLVAIRTQNTIGDGEDIPVAIVNAELHQQYERSTMIRGDIPVPRQNEYSQVMMWARRAEDTKRKMEVVLLDG